MANFTGESTSSALENAAMDLESTSKSNAQPIEQPIQFQEGPTSSTNGVTKPSSSEDVLSTTATNPTQENIGVPMTDHVENEMPQQKKATNNVSARYGDYDDYQILPEAPWPPPIFVRQGLSPQERYYIEHRWYSQWSFFDTKATQSKNRYYRTQIIVGLGSVTVPVLVGINASGIAADILYFVTVFISLSVAMATAIEALYTFGDNWRSYRSAAEDMYQEKSLYDVKAGRYMNNKQAFIRFVERCEEIIAQQNGRWVQSQEKAAEQIREDADEFVDRAIGVTDQFGNPIAATSTTTTTVTTQPSNSPGSGMQVTEIHSESYSDTETYTEPMNEDPMTEAYIDPNTESYEGADEEDPAPTSFG